MPIDSGNIAGLNCHVLTTVLHVSGFWNSRGFDSMPNYVVVVLHLLQLAEFLSNTGFACG